MALPQWSETELQLRFRPEVLRITQERDTRNHLYELLGSTLQFVIETADLGVSLTFCLSWKTQTQKAVNKANRIGRFLKRNVGT